MTYSHSRSSLTTTRTDLSRILQYERARRAAAPETEERLIEGLTRDQVIQRYARKVMYIARRIAHHWVRRPGDYRHLGLGHGYPERRRYAAHD